VVFVDATGATAGQNGSLSHPYQTPNAAVLAVAAAGWNDAIIKIAPGSYATPIAVTGAPLLQSLIFAGWANMWPGTMLADMPGLDADISIDEGIAVHFSQLHLSGTTISSTTPLTDDLEVAFTDCFLGANLSAHIIDVSFLHTNIEANITAATLAAVATDGFSWSSIVNNAVVITPADYPRQFLDTGAEELHAVTLGTTGLAIGASATIPQPFIGVRPGEFAIACMALPVAADYTISFSHTDDDLVYFRLRNDSRVSTNFAEACTIVVFHAGMPLHPPR
jgi:hypothetical protein